MCNILKYMKYKVVQIRSLDQLHIIFIVLVCVWIYCTSAVNMSLLNWVGMLWLVDKNRMGPVRLTWFHVIVCLCGKLFTDDWECLHMLCFSWWHVTCIHITSVTLAMIGIDYQV